MTLLHIAIGFANKPVPVTEVQQVFGTSAWARYAPNCWVVSTHENPRAIAERVHALCSPQDSVLVCELHASNYYGWLQKEIWDWLKARG